MWSGKQPAYLKTKVDSCKELSHSQPTISFPPPLISRPNNILMIASGNPIFSYIFCLSQQCPLLLKGFSVWSVLVWICVQLSTQFIYFFVTQDCPEHFLEAPWKWLPDGRRGGAATVWAMPAFPGRPLCRRHLPPLQLPRRPWRPVRQVWATH